MSDDLPEQAYADLEAIASMAKKAQNALTVDDTDRAADVLADIHATAEAWETPEDGGGA